MKTISSSFDHNDTRLYMMRYRQIETHDTPYVSQLQQPDIIREHAPV